MTLAEWTTSRDYRDLPRIDRAEVTLLWCDDFWDGPLSGIAVYRGERLWYQMCEEYSPPSDDAEWPWYRRFLLVRLTPDQLRDEEYWHDLFCRYVGTHFDWDESRTDRDPRPPELHDQSYEPYSTRIEPDLSGNELVGWFET